ncbi:sugar phosphate isomerase/epimerase family protein [Sinomonas sp. ASV486]|uniref:sugar phosphate isomerase/epimerase family protein n=1 Tax=Sinomonas sp. ASV486 TaxID=3051170 RepID=UPI0027DB9987|nr:sugar phosphate isomerase/epimerase family protein [Sinomonas sp. ASV486]MDQ4491200.1 sugar phosphate isomerase/epimerase family protein [Sinomonas sp. ASV486]MDQ4491860.1 sugar phosphate isomerase/epimerase family protein [Sinomonas sp. ASV486]MDQ4491972.1 sugar phosphate isomerase/epimerase family protein [Sinomonas sp. ASV486]
MPSTTERFVATCWTSAGDAAPLRSPETSPVPLPERIEALAATGWSGFGLVLDDLKAAQSSMGFAALNRLVRSHGLTHVEVELLARWWEPREVWGTDWDLLLHAAEALHAPFVKIGSDFGTPPADLGFMVEPLRTLAGEAEKRGTRVALEPVAFTLVDTIPRGADLMRRVDHPACGLIVDFWHVYRKGTSLAELRSSLTADQIFGVELNDAHNEIQGTLFEDTRDHRCYLGQGDQDVAGFIRTMQDIGFKGPWGVEILSEEHRALPVQTALAAAMATTRPFFESDE